MVATTPAAVEQEPLVFLHVRLLILAVVLLGGCKDATVGEMVADAAANATDATDATDADRLRESGSEGSLACNQLTLMGPWVLVSRGGGPVQCRFPPGPPPDGVYDLISNQVYAPGWPAFPGRETLAISENATRFDQVWETDTGIGRWSGILDTQGGSFGIWITCGGSGAALPDYCFTTETLSVDTGGSVGLYLRRGF